MAQESQWCGSGPCPKAWSQEWWWCKFQSKRHRHSMSQPETRQWVNSPSPRLFSIQVFSRLGEAHPYGEGQSALLSLLTQMSISFRNTLQDTLRIMSSKYLDPAWLSQVDHKITHHCSHEIKRWLLLGRKVMTNSDSRLKSRDTILPAKVYLVKVMVFPVVMYEYESLTIKKAEC